MAEVKIIERNGHKYATVELLLEDEPRLSGSGKTYTIGTTGGLMPTATKFKHNGKDKSVKVNLTLSVDA